jgi:hypothetical protein
MKRSLTTREQPYRRKNLASRDRAAARAGEQVGVDAGDSPAAGKVAKLINHNLATFMEPNPSGSVGDRPHVVNEFPKLQPDTVGPIRRRQDAQLINSKI